ncbi:ATPase dynein-related AAA domain-containing protein [Halomonas sp. NYA30]
MAKKNGNKRNPSQVAPGAPAAISRQAASLEKLGPIWSASFENASKIYQATGSNIDIDVDKESVDKVLDSLRKIEESDTVARWIERFAEVCKELSKYQDKLNEEYLQRWDQASKLGEENDAENKRLQDEAERIEADRAALEQRINDVDNVALELANKKNELLIMERSLKQREANAEAGFAEENEKALRQLEGQQRQLTIQRESDLEDLQNRKKALAEEIRQAERQLNGIKHSCSEAEAERIKLLDEKEGELRQEKARLSRDRTRLDRGWSELKTEQAELEERVTEEVEAERSGFALELAKVSGQREKAWEKVQELQERLYELQELGAALGNRSPVELLENLEKFSAENRDLKRQLEVSDTAELQRVNQYLRDKASDLERDIAALRPELDEARRELSVKRVAATELEAIAREKRVLESHKNTLTVHIDDLETRIDQLTNAQKAKTSFPAMSNMDTDKDFQASIELEHVPDLKVFAEELQHRIAQAEKNVELFYPIEDIRLLLGGLAMSQLHVFQGISGTGKTSLAKAFAKAMGGFCQDIAVQAGWRDRDDLLGHFNAFERRFYEKDCLQALYKAQTPHWQDTCNVILLDEMNLSRPEQYFAEFLSALEKNNPDERLISLSETALPGAPRMLRDGRQILVPNNVWFIGTANHDETTNELADKTYDRSHVMTLPKQDHSFQIKDYQPASYSFRSLQNAFDNACREHATSVKNLLGQLTGNEFTRQLENDFGLGWGNRFEKQALRFVPVMMASGATRGEALDHLLASRIMRQGKVTGRFDVNADSVHKLMASLEAFWNHSNLESIPVVSLELLEKDIKRKEGGF